jgi:glycosyltransferase involved in cell wall biosynthesis
VAVGTEDLQRDFPPGTSLHPMPDLVRELSPRADGSALGRLQALIRGHRFDVVQTHQSKAGALGRIAARGSTPAIVHTVHMASFGPAYGRIQNMLFLALERWMARFTHKFVFVGAELERRYVAAGVVSPGRSTIVRSPIKNLDALLELRDRRADQCEGARAAIGVPSGRRVALMVAALDRRKRHRLAIKALSPLLAEGRTQLVIAGEGPEQRALQDLCCRLGVADSVLFLGFVDDVGPLYAAADVLVQASTLEGVPQSVVQAVAAGVPTVATEVDGVREVIADARHVLVLPPDGRGLLGAVSSRLSAPAPPPAPREAVTPWLPDTVDKELVGLHEWMEARAAPGRISSSTTQQHLPTPLPTARITKEPATR